MGHRRGVTVGCSPVKLPDINVSRGKRRTNDCPVENTCYAKHTGAMLDNTIGAQKQDQISDYHPEKAEKAT
jgi:hypothetical protein